MSTGPVLEVNQLGPRSVLPQERFAVLRIKGEMLPGATVRGAYSIVVDGDIRGESAEACRVEIEGDLIVRGRVHQADVRARRVMVAGRVSRARVVASCDVVLKDDVLDSDLKAGDMARKSDETILLRGRLQAAEAARSGLEQQLKLETRRMDRLLEATRLSFDFSIGDIVTRRGQGLKIDLAPFYRVVDSPDEERIDRALREFFAKAVVGMLTRTNRPFIAESDANRRVFTAAVRRLHELISLAREVDRQTTRASVLQETLAASEEALSEPGARVVVSGRLIPDLDLAFDIPGSVGPDKAEVTEVRALSMQVRGGGIANQLEVTRTDRAGQRSLNTVPPADMRSVCIRVTDGTISWTAVPDDGLSQNCDEIGDHRVEEQR